MRLTPVPAAGHAVPSTGYEPLSVCRLRNIANARAQALGLTGTDALHGYLVQRMGRFLAAHGRRLVGWDEILEPGLSTDATILSWRGLEGALTAARRGNDTVLSPDPGLYLDHRQSSAADEPGWSADSASTTSVPLPNARISESASAPVMAIRASTMKTTLLAEVSNWPLILWTLKPRLPSQS